MQLVSACAVRRILSFLTRFAALAFLASVGTAASAQDQRDGEWKPLFNGEDLDGWFNPYDWGEAVVMDGVIQLHTIKEKFFLLTKYTYSDFIFEAEVKLPEGKANSGFMFRCHYEPNRVWGYQAEVDPSPRAWSGGLYDEARRQWLHPVKPEDSEYNRKNWSEERKDAFKAGEWNQYRIHCEGNRIRIYVNGVLTTDLEDAEDSVGRFGLQHHGEVGQVYQFRNIRIKEL